MNRASLTVAARAITAARAPAPNGAGGASHPGAVLLARGYQAFATGDIPAVMSIFADIGWHVPGSSAIAGHYRGRDAVAGFFAQLAQRSGGSFRLDVHDIVGSARVRRQLRRRSYRGHDHRDREAAGGGCAGPETAPRRRAGPLGRHPERAGAKNTVRSG